MTKTEFLEMLNSELKRLGIADAGDITEEYEQHFAFKTAEGYTEEEISAKLGDPCAIAAQYNSPTKENKSGKTAITTVGLCVADFVFGIFGIIMFAWEIVMAVLTVSFGAVSVCLFGNFEKLIFVSMPKMPYLCAAILGIAFAALTVLALVGTVYFARFIGQLIRSLGRFNKNALAYAHGKAPLPAHSVYPHFSVKSGRILRKTSLISAVIFAVCFIVGFAVCALSAGNIEFWHTWNWFV